jgi:hypothetical protein
MNFYILDLEQLQSGDLSSPTKFIIYKTLKGPWKLTGRKKNHPLGGDTISNSIRSSTARVSSMKTSTTCEAAMRTRIRRNIKSTSSPGPDLILVRVSFKQISKSFDLKEYHNFPLKFLVIAVPGSN